MRLLIGNQPIALTADATISMERSSPALNENVGSFSYPFSVPTEPNQRILGWPGDLNRVGDIPDKSFILEDQGIQVLRGEVEYDTVTKQEIGIVLKSGLTEFHALVESANLQDNGSSLSDLDWGSEPWFSDQPTSWELLLAKLTSWDQANRAENAPYVLAPVQLFRDALPVIFANKPNASGYLYSRWWDAGSDSSYFYMLQFRAWWMIEKIFGVYGYTIVLDELKVSEFKQLVVFTRPFVVSAGAPDPEMNPDADRNSIIVFPPIDNLEYANLMPEVKTLDFLSEMKSLMGLAYDIDDLKKEVKIIQLQNVLSPGDQVQELTQLSGWQHKEGKSAAADGYSLSYQTQDDELDNRAGYVVNTVVATYHDMPMPVSEGYICRVTNVGRDHITVKNDIGYYWAQLGRLKPYATGSEKTKIEFNVKVPQSIYNGSLFKGPKFNAISTGPQHGMGLYDMPGIYVSLYRGLVTNFLIITIPFQTFPIPFLSADKWITSEQLDLSPEGLYNSVYAEYLTWKTTSSARTFTKYVQLTLPQLLSLAWGKSYTISGVKVILSKINYDLPFTGIVKVEGYVV